MREKQVTAESRVGPVSQGFYEKTHLEWHVGAHRKTRRELGLHYLHVCV